MSLMLLLAAAAAPPMVVVDEREVMRDEPPPHGEIGMSTAYRISDAVPQPRSMEFRKRVLHVGAAIGVHPIAHDEVYYVLSGEGVVTSDGVEKPLTPGMAAYLHKDAKVGIRQVGKEPLARHQARGTLPMRLATSASIALSSAWLSTPDSISRRINSSTRAARKCSSPRSET
jgi:mannose-6-phosphate isomerase-like protein (cupin superfamily)